MKENPLKGYYLTRIYGGDNPFTTVMDLFREEGVALCQKIAPNRGMGKNPDQAAYLAAREKVEDWLRESAKESGVDIREKNPIYFALTDKPEPSTAKRQVVSIPADEVDLSSCSFTYDDSFNSHRAFTTGGRERANNDVPAHPMHGKVLNAEQLAEALKTHAPLGHYDEKGRYIEVQVWARSLEAPKPVLSPSRVPRMMSPTS